MSNENTSRYNVGDKVVVSCEYSDLDLLEAEVVAVNGNSYEVRLTGIFSFHSTELRKAG